MLVNLRDICAIAEQNNMAIASFNTEPRGARAALDAAEQTGYPVILSHARATTHLRRSTTWDPRW